MDTPEVTDGSEHGRTSTLESTDQKVGGSSPSERAQVRAPFASRRGSFANTLANSGTLGGGRYGAGEDVGGLGELVADGVDIHAQNFLAQGLPPIRLITSS